MRMFEVMAFSSAVMALCVSCEEGKPPPAPTAKASSESALFQNFDGDKLREKYSSRFESVAGGGSRSNVTITPPGDMFRDFTLRGKISEDQLRRLLVDLKADLMNLAKASGVGIVQEPKEMVADRLNGLPYAQFKSQYAGSLQGFYFTYRQGSLVGGVDVIAGTSTSGTEKEWMLLCSVHEGAR